MTAFIKLKKIMLVIYFMHLLKSFVMYYELRIKVVKKSITYLIIFFNPLFELIVKNRNFAK